MRVFRAEYLLKVGTDVFVGCGAPPEEAEIVAKDLVESSLMGLDSHGIVRYIEYTDLVLKGKVRPGAPIRIAQETPTTATVDCGLNFGQVGGDFMVDVVCEKARKSNIACVISRNSAHVGRLGGYAQKVAERGMFCLAACNSSKHGHFVVPWGGRDGRLATNPLAFAAPTSGWPVVLDMSTSMISEGKVRVLMHHGKPVPPGSIQDAHGNATTDPKDFYVPPRGTILPFGSELGYKGFGLSLLVEIMGGVMAGAASSVDNQYVNGLSLIAINPDAFCGGERFVDLMDDLCAYQTSAAPAPGFEEVVMPGAYDFRMREARLEQGIPVMEQTWDSIIESSRRVGVTIREPLHETTSQTEIAAAHGR